MKRVSVRSAGGESVQKGAGLEGRGRAHGEHAMRLAILAARGDTFFAPIDEPHFEPVLP
jgi:hypothetical protein